MVDLVTLAIPVFLLGIGVEYAIGKATKRKIFRGPDVVNDLSLGTLQTLAGVVGGAGIVGGYWFIYEHWRLTTVPETALMWALAFLAEDFLYYWFHRVSHRMNIGWATHAPHHSSEDFNFAVALRQGPFQPFFSHLFYLPMAFIGFSPEMFAVVGGINTIYQYFIHTELVGKLGPLEWVFNTPSHHRVHHGCNGRYLDRNHGGVFILWDRLFGTFEPETDRPVYGTVKQVTSWNPLAATAAPFVDIWRLGARSQHFFDRIKIWFMPPEWVPEGVRLEWPDVVTRPKFDHKPGAAAGVYVAAMFAVTLVIIVLFLFVGAKTMTTGSLWLSVAWLALSLGNLGAILDGKPWARPLEIARLVALAPLVFFTVP